MLDKIFELLNRQPILSISLIFVLIIVLAVVFRKVIIDYIRKKFNLYNEEEIRQAVTQTYSENISNTIIKALKNK